MPWSQGGLTLLNVQDSAIKCRPGRWWNTDPALTTTERARFDMATPKLCSIDGCGKRHKAHGLCSAHYAKLRKYGDPLAEDRRPKKVFAPCVIPGCEEMGSSSRFGLCGGHAHRKHRYGDPLGGRRGKRTPNGIPYKWLLEHVDYQGSECLIWPFAKRHLGYGGIVMRDGVTRSPHREICILAHGEPPFEKAIAAHSCGNGHNGCVNPKHLSWATTKENTLDYVVHRAGALSEIQIRAMRVLAPQFSVSELAEIFNVGEWVVPPVIERKVIQCL